MIAFFILPLFCQLFLNLSFLEFAQDLSTPFHEKCLSWISLKNEGSEIRRALLCGQQIQTPSLELQLKQLGLIHLIVVSGSHLEFLSRFLKWIKIPQTLILLFLGLFLLLTSFQAPAVRCFIFLVTKSRVKHHAHLWSSLICLFLFPEWLSSLSFWMSLCASLILQISSQVIEQQNPLSDLATQVFIYFCFLPITLFLTPLGPLSIFTNLIFSAWLGAVWIPFALLPHSDSIFLWLLRRAEDLPPVPSTSSSYTLFLIFLITYSGVLLCYEIKNSISKKRSALY